jgi:isochorismate pyruvate lyase
MAIGFSSVWHKGFHAAVEGTSGKRYCPLMTRTQSLNLEALRQQIDAIDNELLAALGRRQALVEQVIAVKTRDKLPARIPERVTEVVDRVAQAAPKHGTSSELAKAVWTAMIEWFIAFEEKALHTGK